MRPHLLHLGNYLGSPCSRPHCRPSPAPPGSRCDGPEPASRRQPLFARKRRKISRRQPQQSSARVDKCRSAWETSHSHRSFPIKTPLVSVESQLQYCHARGSPPLQRSNSTRMDRRNMNTCSPSQLIAASSTRQAAQGNKEEEHPHHHPFLMNEE